jgi:hypothetical protein
LNEKLVELSVTPTYSAVGPNEASFTLILRRSMLAPPAIAIATIPSGAGISRQLIETATNGECVLNSTEI